MPSGRPATLAAAMVMAALAASAPAQPGRDTGRVVIITVPQFMVQAESFKAVDQTGWTNWGSDEVHAVFADFNPIDERATSEYDDVDAGETVAFIAPDRCISPLPNCFGGKDTVKFKVSFWEADANVGVGGLLGLDKPTLAGGHDSYETGIDYGDDLIGRASIEWTRNDLLGTLPEVGAAVERQVKLQGGDGDYRFNYRITRLADARRRVIVPVPTREP